MTTLINIKISLTGFFAAAVIASSALAGMQDTDFNEGNKLYRDENYAGAINAYNKVLFGGYESGELYFNLGNAYFRNGNLGLAILNYEKARRFLPGDKDLKANLQIANSRVADKIETPRLAIWGVFFSVREMTTLGGWGKLTFILFLFGLAGTAVYYYLPRGKWKKLIFTAIIPVFCLFIAAAAFFAWKWNREANVKEMIVLSEKVEITAAPDDGAKGLFLLHEGVKVRALQELPPWVEISLPDGKKGWVKTESLGKI